MAESLTGIPNKVKLTSKLRHCSVPLLFATKAEFNTGRMRDGLQVRQQAGARADERWIGVARCMPFRLSVYWTAVAHR